MKRYFVIIMFVMAALTAAGKQSAKYVFYFIGDGMGLAHICLTEYYQSYQTTGNIGSIPVVFSNFPTLGTAVTHSDSNYITDSAAAGTALSTGNKTKNGRLGVSTDKKTNFTSISYKIHNAGYKVAITSTVGLNHATPAAFYANSDSRSRYYEIAKQVCKSDFEFFAGGGFIDSEGKENDMPSVYEEVEKCGYKIIEGMDEYKGMKRKPGKAILLQNGGREKTELPYAIDKKEGDMTQADLVSASIDFLYDQKHDNGFFIMSEGGKIDWAAHSNDTKAVVEEIISLSDAVAVAVDFYNAHPDETLIVVTADHETGGLTMGYKDGYNIFFEKLDAVTCSKDMMDDEEKEKADEIAKEARIGWTTSSHTGANVPVYAIGAGSELFSGRMDNTDIPKKICEAMGVKY